MSKINWKFNIGDHICNNNKDVIIINRKINASTIRNRCNGNSIPYKGYIFTYANNN